MGLNGETPIAGWFIIYFMENPTKMDDLGVPLFQGFVSKFRTPKNGHWEIVNKTVLQRTFLPPEIGELLEGFAIS